MTGASRVPDGGLPSVPQRWLGYLAGHVQHLRTSSSTNSNLAWWELGTTMSRSSRTLVIAVLAGLIVGIGNIPVDLVATPLGLTFALQRGLVVGILHGLVGGLAFGLIYWFADGRHVENAGGERGYIESIFPGQAIVSIG